MLMINFARKFTCSPSRSRAGSESDVHSDGFMCKLKRGVNSCYTASTVRSREGSASASGRSRKPSVPRADRHITIKTPDTKIFLDPDMKPVGKLDSLRSSGSTASPSEAFWPSERSVWHSERSGWQSERSGYASERTNYESEQCAHPHWPSERTNWDSERPPIDRGCSQPNWASERTVWDSERLQPEEPKCPSDVLITASGRGKRRTASSLAPPKNFDSAVQTKAQEALVPETKVKIDDETSVPFDVYASLLDAARHNRAQHVIRGKGRRQRLVNMGYDSYH